MRRSLSLILATAMLVGVAATPAFAKGGSSRSTLGEQILADADGKFDRRSWDYDVIGEVVKAILASGIETKLGASVDPGVELTAFLPNDQAFRKLAKDLTGQWVKKEADIIPAILSAVGGDLALVNAVVEYHVVPGKIRSKDAFRSDGATLTSIMGAGFVVDVKGKKRVTLVDNEPDLRDPRLIRRDLDNRASNGIWHGIDRVLIPIDL